MTTISSAVQDRKTVDDPIEKPVGIFVNNCVEETRRIASDITHQYTLGTLLPMAPSSEKGLENGLTSVDFSPYQTAPTYAQQQQRRTIA
ncbi:hypothetical protein COOONC_05714 [Cooperia oncophora]